MTLSDVGSIWRVLAALVGLGLVARALYPFYVERSRQRDVDRESEDVDAYIEALERQQNGARK